MKKKIFIVLAAVLVLAAGTAFFYLCDGDRSAIYDSAIDNKQG